jgi:Zn finger protein HypA/HybF involved in hydrogenase expression
MTVQKRRRKAHNAIRRRHFTSVERLDKGVFSNPATRSKREMSKLECADCDGEGDLEINGRVIPCPTCHGHGDIREPEMAVAR